MRKDRNTKPKNVDYFRVPRKLWRIIKRELPKETKRKGPGRPPIPHRNVVDGLWYILGRSDDTIKVAGKRLGPAEVESVLVNHPAVNEAAVIGIPDKIKGNAVVCFCVLAPGFEPSDLLCENLQAKISAEMGKPLQPKEIKFVSDLPKTRNAKVMRRIIRSAYLGNDLGDTSSLLNPKAVEDIQNAQ